MAIDGWGTIAEGVCNSGWLVCLYANTVVDFYAKDQRRGGLGTCYRT